jgi:hypothetical protein
MKTKILKFGIELEAEYSTELAHNIALKYGWDIKDDGSIHTCSDCEYQDLHALETVSKPIEYTATNITAVKKLFDYLQTQYKNGKFHFNDSCGLHFHFSFTPQRPPELWCIEFANYFAKQIATRFPKAYKLRKDNHFCKFDLTQQDIANAKFYDRYKFVNLRPAFQRHKTLEIRAFPSDEPRKMKRYFLATLMAINDFLTIANSGALDKKYVFKDKTQGVDTAEWNEKADNKPITDSETILTIAVD